jgi:hypothetical protein
MRGLTTRLEAIARVFNKELLSTYRTYCGNYPHADKTLARSVLFAAFAL